MYWTDCCECAYKTGYKDFTEGVTKKYQDIIANATIDAVDEAYLRGYHAAEADVNKKILESGAN